MQFLPPSVHRSLLALLVASTFVLLAGCASAGRQVSSQPREPGPAEIAFRKQYDRSARAAFLAESLGAGGPFSAEKTPPETGVAIILERTPCYGTCPSYGIRLGSDGMLRYFGQKYVKYLGCRQASLGPEVFDVAYRLAWGIGFFSLRPAYLALETDVSSTYVWVESKARRKIVWDYGEAAPAALWLFEDFLESLTLSASWRERPDIKMFAACLNPGATSSELSSEK